MSKRKPLEIQEVLPHKRAMKLTQQEAFFAGGLINSLIETVTNSEDEYERMNRPSKRYNGKVLIRYERKGKKTPSTISCSDKGRGMSYDELKNKMKSYAEGGKSADASRGFFGKGLLDAISIGKTTIVTGRGGVFTTLIHDHKKSINRFYDTSLEELDESKLKKQGFYVKIELPLGKPKFNPQVATLKNQIGTYYSLRKMLSTDKNKDYHNTLDLNFQSVNGKETKPEKINYIEPKNTILYDEKIHIDYEGQTAEAKLIIKKMTEEDENNIDNLAFTNSGFLISGKKAIHSKTFFGSKYEHNWGKNYFGELQCEQIDILQKDYDLDDPDNNPNYNPDLIIKQDRSLELNKNHPFTISMNDKCMKILDELIKKDIDKTPDKAKSDNLDKKISKMLNIATKELEETLDLGDGPINSKLDWYTFPPKIKIQKGETKTIVVRGKIIDFQNQSLELRIEENNKSSIKIKNKKVQLKPTSKEDQYKATFEVTGNEETISPLQVKFDLDNETKLDTMLEVYLLKNREFANDLEFEFKNYNVGTKYSKKIKCFVKYPDLLNKKSTYAKISFDNHNAIKITDKDNTHCKFNYVVGTNYGIAEIELKGLKRFDTTSLTVSLDNNFATTSIKVDDKDKDEPTSKYTHEVVPRDLNGLRALWDPDIPTKLLISATCKINKKVLGEWDPNSKKFTNEDSPEWETILKEIVSENVTTKQMEQVAHINPTKYENDSASANVNLITFEFHTVKNRLLSIL